MPFIRYIAVRPETVVSVVNTGKYPESLPAYLQIKTDCFQVKETASDCVSEVNTKLHQIFILILALPENNNPIVLKPEWIQRIFVYSVLGEKLLNKLFAGVCPKPVIIRSDIYPPTFASKTTSNVLQNEDTSLSDLTQVPVATAITSPKKRNFDNASVVSSPLIFSTPTSPPRQTNLSVINRIDSSVQHINLLKSAFSNAKKKILISTYGINEETFEEANLYELIDRATMRGVKIYIYCHDRKLVDEKILHFLENQKDIYLAPINTHSKILAVDKDLVAIGSCNWLAIMDEQYNSNETENSSFVYRGIASNELIEDLWAYIKYYRNIQFENNFQLQQFDQDDSNEYSTDYSIEEGSLLSCLSLLGLHQDFIDKSFLSAKNRIIICSPFISASGNFEDDFGLKMLTETTRRGVDIYFVCLPEQVENSEFDSYLAQLHSPRIHLVPMENIHLKTFIVDDDTIAEGSFNWLSAARSEESQFHNHEVTLVVQGNMAKKLIEEGFDRSEVGRTLARLDDAPRRKQFKSFRRG